MDVSQERLRADIESNAEFGSVGGEGRGRTVLTGSDADRKARERLVERMGDAGLDARVDAVGNIAGRWEPEGADPDADPVASGSHLDSVPRGGIFDGPLGVYAALEAVRAMQDAGIEPARPVEVVSFTEEEGATYPGVLGSSVAAGERTVEEALALADDGGRTLEEALSGIGFRGEGCLDAADWDAWIELHVEQSERLEGAGVPVGVVTTITGITSCSVTIEGEANHAGATPMPDRTDALAAAAEFVLDVERAADEVVATESETAVGTVGTADVVPNATNVVAGRVGTSVDVRDVTEGAIEELVDRARKSLARIERERGVETALEEGGGLTPTPMADRIREAAGAAGERAGIGTMEMHSGAFHDTAYVAGVTDAGMLFAPSRDGISHSPHEWTDWEDCARATRVLAGALADLAGG